MSEILPQTILIVDDEAHVRNVMQLKFRGAGFTVETACDGEEGLRLAAELQPVLVLSDFQMPKMNGLQMCRGLAADERTKSIPIVLVTSRDFDITETERAGTNIRAVRNKPFSPREILRLVTDILAAQPKPAAA